MGCGASIPNHHPTPKPNNGLLAPPPQISVRRADSPIAIYCPPPSDFELSDGGFDDEVESSTEVKTTAAHEERREEDHGEDKDEHDHEEDDDDWPLDPHMTTNGGRIVEIPDISHPTTPIDPSAFDNVEQMSFEEACEKLDRVIDHLRSNHHVQRRAITAAGDRDRSIVDPDHHHQKQEAPNRSTDEENPLVFCPWKFIKYYSYNNRPNLPDDLADRWLERLVDNRLASVCVNIWPTFEQQYVREPNAKTLQAFVQPVTTLWNGTRCSSTFCEQFLASDGMKTILATLRHPTFAPQAINAQLHHTMFCVIPDGCVSILYNVQRALGHGAKFKFRRKGGRETVADLLHQCEAINIRSKSLFCLAYASNEDELGVLLDPSKMAPNSKTQDAIISAIDEALRKETRDGGFESLGADFALIELIDCLNRLALNDGNKQRLMQAGMVLAYKRVLSEPRRDSEIVQTLKGLWTLSFDRTNFDTLRIDLELLSKLRHTSGWKNRRISDLASNLLWWLTFGGVRDESNESIDMTAVIRSDQSDRRGVSILYHAKWRQWALLMKNELERLGYRVWMGEDWCESEMDSEFAYMIDGIQQSNLIILCLSVPYQESPRCRTELEYARNLKKPMIALKVDTDYESNGWLQRFLGDHQSSVTDISSPKSLESNLRPLLDAIRDEHRRSSDPSAANLRKNVQFRVVSDPNSNDRILHKLAQSSTAGLGSRTTKVDDHDHHELDVSRWKQAQVQRWLQSIGIVDVAAGKFDEVDGRKLLALKETYFTVSSAYFKELKRLLGRRSLDAMLTFTNGLLVL